MKKYRIFILALILMFVLAACGDEGTASGSQGQDILSTPENHAKEVGWGSVISFGTYEQDNNPDNGAEPIEWIVLESNANGIFVLSKDVLDAGYFHEDDSDVYWDKCDLRTWLNTDFYETAFEETEQNSLLLSDVITSGSEVDHLVGCEATRDKVFLLSIDEIEQYFQIAWGDAGHFYDNNLRARASDYAVSRGLAVNDNHYVKWFLRSPGYWGVRRCAAVNATGDISTIAIKDDDFLGIRPAMWLSPDAEFEIVQSAASDTEAGMEDLFPEDWEGRYIIEENEDCISVYCKMAYELDEKEKSLLFSVYYITNDNLVLPDYTNLGTYDGNPVQATLFWDIPVFSSDAIAQEYTDMFYDVGEIFDALEDRIAELEHFRQVELYGFDRSLYTIPNGNIESGIYQLDCSDWSEESKNKILGEYNHTSYLSVNPDGTLYLSLGSKEPIKGTILVAANQNILPEGEPECILWFEGGSIQPVYSLQLTLTVWGMEEAVLQPEAPEGLDGSVWTFIWVSSDFWTEESLRGDIG